ncbi:MAG: alanine--tRNA ligase, partial [Eubacteriales bacterium]
CSEVYYDRGERFGCGDPNCTVGCECDRYMEVWNNVFSQFDNDGKGNYTELAQKNIDTGMGLERLAVVCQDVYSLFDVDTVMSITDKVTELTGASYGNSTKMDISLRVITDHIRSGVFMICDGVLPSNEGRGYVLRRLLRRAARHGKLLGVNEPFLYQVVATVVKENAGQYTDLGEKESYITRVVKVEEENFGKTIDAGMKIFADILAIHKAEGKTVFDGADAFKLYDTFGFPIDLTAEMVEEEGMTVDEVGFKALMEEQKIRARKAREALGDLGWAGVEFGKEVPESTFVGYDRMTEEGCKVVAIVVENEQAEEIVAGAEAIVVLDKTPFYAEMGGQAADHGTIVADGMVFAVRDVQKNKGGKYMHTGKLVEGSMKLGDLVTGQVDVERHRSIMRAHSVTHLLQSALKIVLGDHVHQAGSLVEPDRLRFDFTHFSAITPEELGKINALVNDMILEGVDVSTKEMTIDEAKAAGAMALFGEKYGDTVRVVTMGNFSMELCGGTHLDNVAKAGVFRIKSEASVASGVRRIEATVGKASLETMNANQDMLFRMAEILKTNPGELAAKAEQQVLELKDSKKMIEQFKTKEALSEAQQFLMSAKTVGGLTVIINSRNGVDAAELRQKGDFLKDKDASVVAVLAAVNGEKITFLAVCGKDAVKKGIKAGDLVRHVSAICGGKGGGKPDSAMGGGSNLLKLDDALAQVDDFVAEKIGL